jgi:hypothetical protein
MKNTNVKKKKKLTTPKMEVFKTFLACMDAQ